MTALVLSSFVGFTEVTLTELMDGGKDDPELPDKLY